jgi:hypothetical protein
VHYSAVFDAEVEEEKTGDFDMQRAKKKTRALNAEENGDVRRRAI